MPLFPSDFKKFKHVKSDDKTTTLRHPKGHEITIMHSALSKDMRTQLKALAEGGIVEEADRKGYLGGQRQVDQEIKDKPKLQEYPANDGKDVRTEDQKRRAAEFERTGGASENPPQQYAEGTTNVQPMQAAPEVAPQQQSEQAQLDPDMLRKREIYNKMLSNVEPENPTMIPQNMAFGPNGEEPKDFSPKTWGIADQMFQREKASNAADATQAQQQAIQMNSARAAAGLASMPVPDVPNGPQIPGSQSPQVQQEASALTPPQAQQAIQQTPASSMQDVESMMKSGYQSKLAGIDQQAAAQQQMAQDQVMALQRAQDAKVNAQASYQKHFDELDMERQNLMHDVQSGQVNPEKFWDNHSKLATGIGIILAGFNPTNHPNAAIDFLKNQMEMNIQAQKENLGAKQNLLSANMRQFGNIKDAMDMTRIMQNDLMTNELQQAAAKASSPMAKAAALQAAGQIKMESAPLFQNFAMRRTMMGLANSGDPHAADAMLGYLRVTNPDMAKEMESRLVPGIGMAHIPVSEKVREQLTQYQQADSAIQDLQKFVKSHNTFVPGTADYNIGQQKALALQALVRESKLGTVYREGEQPLLDKFVNSNPAGALKMMKTMPQLKELLGSNMRNYNVLKQQYGLPVSKSEPVIRMTKDGKKAAFDPDTKQFLGYK